jgi:hypothetical protein
MWRRASAIWLSQKWNTRFPLSRRDESKPLAGFLWNVFAGWDQITGYRKEDIVKKMIAAI